MTWPWLFGLLLAIGVVLLIVLAVRAIGGGIRNDGVRNDGARNAPAAEDSVQSRPGRAREILDERYARGELSTEEYHERLRNIGDDAR